MIILKYLFYMGMAIPLFCELEAILETRRMISIMKRMTEISRLSLDKRKEAFLQDKEVLNEVLRQTFYMSWLFIGLFTTNWPIFLFVILISLIPKRVFIVRFADGLISFGLLLFALLNAFHFHIHIFNLIKSLWF